MMALEDNQQEVNQQCSQACGQNEASFAAQPPEDEAWKIYLQEETARGKPERAQLAAACQRLQKTNLWLAELVVFSGWRIQRLEMQRTELEQAHASLEALNSYLILQARTDGLTGLINHRTFQEELREEMERATRYAAPLSLLFMDVDAFKPYNDRYGHPAGDAVLCGIAGVLQATARANDRIARYGGEEFAVILPGTDAESALFAAERFRVAIEAVRWQERQITISVGVATLSPALREPSVLIAQADKALYCSKERGRNCVTHSSASFFGLPPECRLPVSSGDAERCEGDCP